MKGAPQASHRTGLPRFQQAVDECGLTSRTTADSSAGAVAEHRPVCVKKARLHPARGRCPGVAPLRELWPRMAHREGVLPQEAAQRTILGEGPLP